MVKSITQSKNTRLAVALLVALAVLPLANFGSSLDAYAALRKRPKKQEQTKEQTQGIGGLPPFSGTIPAGSEADSGMLDR